MDAAEIRARRAQHAKMRERDFARINDISEAELTAAYLGHGVVRLRPEAGQILGDLEAVGEVMALTRNESCVHEKIGRYTGVNVGDEVGLVLGDEIDLRVFPRHWVSAFAVDRTGEDGVRRQSLQFFDAFGDAVHKVHLRDASNREAYAALVARYTAPDQSDALPAAAAATAAAARTPAGRDELVAAWRGLTDTHQFHGMLRKLNVERLDALEMAGDDLTWRIDAAAARTLLEGAVAGDVPIMAFVGSRGCIQIHSGPVRNVQPMGPWLNVMDETFHMHLRLDHITDLWAVRKPTRLGHVTSVEAYAADRSLIIQFFGVRHDDVDERADWRMLAEGLPRGDAPTPQRATA